MRRPENTTPCPGKDIDYERVTTELLSENSKYSAALKGRPNAMVFRHGSQNIHFHPFPSVALSGRISMELSQA